MTFAQLQIFVLIAEVGTVTQAAKQLGMTQSAASAAIAALENLYQVKLFHRVGRSLELSEVGKRFLPEAQTTVALVKNTARSLRLYSEKASGHINIAASQTIANYWLPRKLAIFNALNPNVEVNVTMTNSRGVETALTQGKADVGFVEGAVSSADLKTVEVDRDQPVLVVAANRWPSLGGPRGKLNLRNVPWIVREPGSGTRNILENLIAQNKIAWSELDIVLELPSNEAVREAVIAGAGATIISRHVVDLSIQGGALTAVKLNLPPRSYTMVFKARDTQTIAENALFNVVIS